MTTKPPCRPTVSAVIPVYNGLPFLDECLESLLNQETSAGLSLEICVYNDGSTDGTHDSILRWKQRCEERSIPFKYGKGDKPGGVGYAKNRAVHLSSGEFLCFCDADDVSFPRRIQMQHDFTVSRMGGDKVLICGSKFVRNDENATTRYTKWANELSDNQLLVQRFTSHGPTVVAPTWFLLRSLYDKVGGFSEDDVVGHPEDLQFFFKALSLGATVIKVPDCLVMYRYHPNCATFSVTENSIWNMRILELQRCVLSKWDRFTIWNAGKQGKKFYKSLSLENRAKVSALCDVDSSKIRHGKYEIYDERERKIVDCVPIISQKDAVPPVIVCVKLDLTDGGFENLLKEKNWTEGVDYFHFS
ncbi:hypothetical protein L596_007235 [Steinernema carpocapsae]|uniref:Glycosyltransferase 2-like domain-containing protein n=1 Tax=Steinernema carpocapsae TaxID=34508 RepID=A0A4U5P9D1_STECR|nr:hypothetical protein L596_007235 [Steinernema carpocapsae]